MFCQAEERGAPRKGLWERRLGTGRFGRSARKAKNGKGRADLRMEVKERVEEATRL